MAQQYLVIGGNETRLRPGDIPKFQEEKDLGGCFLSLYRDEPDGQKELSFEAVGGPYGLTEYFFPCDVATAEKIVAAVQEGRKLPDIIGPKQMELAIQAVHFHAIAIGVG